jgi:mono/diheme cytochrome c family protein
MTATPGALPKRRAGVALAAVVSAMLATRLIASVSLDPTQTARTQWSGVYTQAQAKRGEVTYQQNCTSCHGSNLTGAEGGPPLAGRAFEMNWDGMTLWDLFDKIHGTMPQSTPGSLSERQCADVLAYVMMIGEAPAGDAELSPDPTVLKIIKYQAAKP